MADQSIILHEMIHHYQKNSKRSFDLRSKNPLDITRRAGNLLSKPFFFNFPRKNNNEGAKMSYSARVDLTLDLQYSIKTLINNLIKHVSSDRIQQKLGFAHLLTK